MDSWKMILTLQKQLWRRPMPLCQIAQYPQSVRSLRKAVNGEFNKISLDRAVFQPTLDPKGIKLGSPISEPLRAQSLGGRHVNAL